MGRDNRISKLHFIFFLLLSSTLFSGHALIHNLKIRDDKRNFFFIENFGFQVNGILNFTVRNFEVDGQPLGKDQHDNVGFVIKRTVTDATSFIEDNPSNAEKCNQIEEAQENEDIVIKIDTDTGVTRYDHVVTSTEDEGFYNTYFINCLSKPISFDLELIQYNVNEDGIRNYFSIGYSPLPTLYGVFTIIYVVVLVLWIFNFIRASSSKTNRIHHLMTVFILLKIFSLLFKTIEQYYLKTTGYAEGWNIIYYIFQGLKGIMLFILLALIGTGWSFIKPFLSDKDKKIFLIVIPLQILDNVALIVIEETAPGSQGWFTWKDIFRLVDIICCGAILIPIIWSIKHLREASNIDGKAARNMNKLKLFRQFYIMVVSYIYATRIIVYLVDATLPFKIVWLGDLFLEGSTLIFFVFVGYKFRPTPDNPYFQLELEDVDTENGSSK